MTGTEREGISTSEERLRLAAEAGEVGIWDWDIAANAVTWSDRVYEMHRLPVGSDFGGLEGFRQRTHPEDWPRVEAALQAALAGGKPYEVEFRHVWPDGQVRWMATRGQLIRAADGTPLRMVGACTDITGRMALLAAERAARQEAEAAGRRMEVLAEAGARLSRSLDQEATLRTIATLLVPGIADWCRIDLVDDAGRPKRALAWHQEADRAARMLELARDVNAGSYTPGSMAWAAATLQAHHGNFRDHAAADHPELRAYVEDFGMHEYFVVPLLARGRVIGAMRVVQAESGRTLPPADRALVQELAHRAALALDNARAYELAEAARRQAEAASRAKDEFLAMLGHELRNPLAPIATALDLMQRRESTAHAQERRIIARQVAHLSRLIDDLLDVSRITQGKVELQRAPVDLRNVVQHALEQTQPLYEQRAEPVQVRGAATPVLVQGDATRLTQVLCNLLINAAKFTPPEGRVTVSVQAEGGEAVLRVQDSGRGIDPDLLPHVFDLFVQGAQALDRRAGGLGLGLAIVRMLVERHGGQVRAGSAGTGQGSTFEVRLPLLDAMQVPLPTLAPVRRPAAAGEHPGVRLLVVDDNVDAAETLAALLRLEGYGVRCAASADAALAVLDEEVPHLAFLDIGLPGMDGHSLARRLRADPRFAGMKLVALTGYGQEKDREQALAARFDEHLVKPVGADLLQRTLEALLVVPPADPSRRT